MSPRRHLVIFVKAPRLGAVKTRLAADVGAVAAWRFYRGTASTLACRLSADRRWVCWLAITPDRFARGGGWRPRHLRRLAQGHGDLGARIARVFRRLPPGPVAIVGSDAPDLTAGHVAAAFRALAANDAVFGPASDGGYWLIGLGRRRPANDLFVPNLFAGVRWSGVHALTDTRANLPQTWRAALLAELPDIDSGADLARRRQAACGKTRYGPG